MKYLNCIFLVLLFFGCQQNSRDVKSLNEASSTEKELPFPKDLMISLNQQLDSLSEDSLLIDFYRNRNEFIWFNSKLELNNSGIGIINLLKNTKAYGVDTIHYQLSNLKQLLEAKKTIESELLLTQDYIKFGKQISHGQIDDVSDYYEFDRRVIDTNWYLILEKGIREKSVIKELLSLQPKNQEYIRLQKGLENYLKRVKLNDSTIKIQEQRKDSLEAYRLARRALVLHGVIKNDSISDSLLLEGIKDFQYEHGLTIDGLIGRETAKELSKSTNDFYNQAKVALEKWRWTKDFEKEHIFVNIATYKLKCYKDNKLMNERSVVVGTNETRTPELDSKLDYIIAYPYWHVPRSIIEGELVAKAIKDSSYLSRNGYELFKGENVIHSQSIDWSNGSNYKFRQKGGGSNALGIIKFIFPNRSSVYFHDTPSKRFFNKGRRAYSHGCIRVEDPLDLAEYFLKNDSSKYSIDTVKSFIKNKTRKVITLNNKTPIYIRYYTVEADIDNNIRFYPDVYFKETELEKYSF